MFFVNLYHQRRFVYTSFTPIIMSSQRIESILKPLLEKTIEGIKLTLILDPRKHSSYIKELRELKDEDLPKDLSKIKDLEQVPVAIRVTRNSKLFYYKTGFSCTIAQWDAMRLAKGNSQSFKEKKSQEQTFDKATKAVEELLENDSFSFENLKTKLTGRHQLNFSDVWLDVISQKKIGTADAYRYAYNSFTKFVGKNISFDRVGADLIEKWEKKMKDDGIGNTSQGMYMRACRVVVNECLRQGYLKQSQYPFGRGNDGKVKIKKGKSRKDEFISVTEIKKLMSFVAPDSWRKSYSELVYQSINFWVFSYLGNGLNMADMALLEWGEYYFQSGESELKFIRKKTQDTTDEDIEIIIPIIPELKTILNEYASTPELGKRIFPQILNGETNEVTIKKAVALENSNIRDRVQVACKLIGIEKKVSMTYARHSFATNLTIAGVSERYISQAMGHSTSKSVTQGYIGLFPPEKRMKFNKMLLEE